MNDTIFYFTVDLPILCSAKQFVINCFSTARDEFNEKDDLVLCRARRVQVESTSISVHFLCRHMHYRFLSFEICEDMSGNWSAFRQIHFLFQF